MTPIIVLLMIFVSCISSFMHSLSSSSIILSREYTIVGSKLMRSKFGIMASTSDTSQSSISTDTNINSASITANTIITTTNTVTGFNKGVEIVKDFLNSIEARKLVNKLVFVDQELHDEAQKLNFWTGKKNETECII